MWLPPKVWFHGSQSTMTGGSSCMNGERGAQHHLVGAQHALGVDHALRLPGRAGGEQDLGDRVGRRRAACAASTAAVGRSPADRRKRVARRRRRACASPRASTSAGTAAAMARANAAPFAAKTRPGVSNVDDVAELAEVAATSANRRARSAHRECRHACAARPSSAWSRSLPERIATGRSGDKSRSSSAAAMARTASECRRIAQSPPAAGGVALRQENPLGRGLRPMGETLGKCVRVRRSGSGERIEDRAVTAALDCYAGRAEPDRPQRRPVFPGVFPGGGERHRIRSEPVLGSRDISAKPRQDATIGGRTASAAPRFDPVGHGS